MSLALFFKSLADLCFYLTFACFFGSFAGFEKNLLPAAFFFSLALLLCALLSERVGDKPLRFLPLLLCGAAWLTGPGLIGSLLLLLPLAYCVYTAVKKNFEPDHLICAGNFSLFLKVLILPLALALIAGQQERLNAFAFPYLLIFLFASVLLLRMLRHDAVTMKSARFQFFNAISLGAAALLSLFFFSEGFRSALKSVFGWIYQYLIAPLLILLSYLAAGIGWVVIQFLNIILGGQGLEGEESSSPITAEEILEELETPAADPFWKTLGKFLLAAALITLAVLVLIRLIKRLIMSGQKKDEDGVVISRTSLTETELAARPLRRIDARTPALKVRFCYQKLLAYTQQSGGELRPHYDSERCEAEQGKLFPEYKTELSEMRRLYLPARYGAEVSEADARRAREILRTVTRRIRLARKQEM